MYKRGAINSGSVIESYMRDRHEFSVICVPVELKKTLDNLKLVRQEPYNSVIRRLVEANSKVR